MKKLLLLLVTVLASLSAWAVTTVYTTTTREAITKNSTIYVGEVVVDGTSEIKYLYTGDLTINYNIVQDVIDCLNGMTDGDFAALLIGKEFDYTLNPPANGFALCSNADFTAAMDENWSSAQYVGTLYYPSFVVTSTVNSNLYDLDEGFKAVLDAIVEEESLGIDSPAFAEKCFISHIGSTSADVITYSNEDGEVIKHVNTIIDYKCEATTFVYTKVELASAYSISLPESFEHGSVTCDKESAAEGETVTLVVIPKDGYELETLTVTIADESEPSGAPSRLRLRGGSVELTPGTEPNTHTFQMPAAPVAVNATFKKSVPAAIDKINADDSNVQRYNLMGQPVGKDYRGIVIEDGKKLIVR